MKVSAYMTSKVITARVDDGVRKTFFKMREHRVRHMPVVNDKGELAGMISDRDLRRPNWVDENIDVSHIYQLDDKLEVGDIMATNVVYVHTYDSIRKATHLLIEHRFGALPVLNKENKLVGILSAHDLLRALENLIDESIEKSPASNS